MVEDISGEDPKWDVLVLTAGNSNQADAFKLQLTHNFSKYFHRYSIVEDYPVGAKIGSGGATLNALLALENEFGAEIFGWRILVLHSGGLSQRLPHVSALGKLFMRLSDGRCLLEVKLESYVSLLRHLSRQNRHGVMIAASDTLEYFPQHFFGASDSEKDINDSDIFPNDNDPNLVSKNSASTITKEDAILLFAHESTVDIAMGHGVYVTEGGDLVCVLQKPNSDELKLLGGYSAEDSADSNNLILTDSCYFLTTNIFGDLIELRKKNGEVKCELCAYGDFLRPLGRRPKLGYLLDARDPELQKWRKIVKEVVGGKKAKVLNLGKNSFFHFGSNREMIENLLENDGAEFSVKFLQNRPISNVIFSDIDHQCQKISTKSFVEYSTLSGNFQVEDGCILSGITAENCSNDPIVIEKDSLLIGLCLKIPGGDSADTTNNKKYVTIWLSTRDDLKKQISAGEKLKWFEHELESHASLWTFQLFPLAKSPAESFEKTAKLRKFGNLGSENDGGRISICDALLSVDHREMLKICNKNS